MLKDRISLVKRDGTVFRDSIRALVQPKLIVIDDPTLPIEVGDRLQRLLPSGLVEAFLVDDPGFYSGLDGVKPHFQVKVSREGASMPQPHTVINNIQGANARVNINSTDHSQNAVLGGERQELFSKLRQALAEASIVGKDAADHDVAIGRMQQSASSETFRRAYVEFMAVAANHVAVFGPLLGALAAFLS